MAASAFRHSMRFLDGGIIMPMPLKEFRKMQAAIRRGLPKLERKLSKDIDEASKLIRACTRALRKRACAKALRK